MSSAFPSGELSNVFVGARRAVPLRMRLFSGISFENCFTPQSCLLHFPQPLSGNRQPETGSIIGEISHLGGTPPPLCRRQPCRVVHSARVHSQLFFFHSALGTRQLGTTVAANGSATAHPLSPQQKRFLIFPLCVLCRHCRQCKRAAHLAAPVALFDACSPTPRV